LCYAQRLDEAETTHRKAVAVQSRLVKQYPEVVAYSFWLSDMEYALARVIGERGDLAAARSLLETAVVRLERLQTQGLRPAPIRSLLATVHRDVAQIFQRSGEEALATQARNQADKLDLDTGHGPTGPRARGGNNP
jgi:hypothetical protein